MPDQPSPSLDADAIAVTLANVRAAAAVIQGATIRTECNESRTLGSVLGCRVRLKFENLQFTSTFKERGALNRLQALGAISNRDVRVVGCVDIPKALNHDDNEGALRP